MNKFQEKIQEFSKNRIFLLLCSITVLFSILIFRLFLLQIIHGEEYEQKLTTSILREVKLPASRGTIYDRYGRPLAVNHVAYSIQIDNSITLDLSGYKPKLVMDFIEYMKQKNMILQIHYLYQIQNLIHLHLKHYKKNKTGNNSMVFLKI